MSPRRPLAPGERRDCEGCGEQIVGALTINKKVAPITIAVYGEDDEMPGNVWLGRNGAGEIVCATLGGPLLEEARRVGIGLHLNHFANCPERKRFERS